MDAVIEPAPSGRARCRGCARAIAKGELRLVERLPNPFAEDRPLALLFHLLCAACKRPEPLLAALAAGGPAVAERAALEQEARRSIAYRRLPRLDGAERAPSARAACRACHAKIDRGAWRLRLVFFADVRFEPAGYLHARCAAAYFETADLLDRVRRFSPELDDEACAELARAMVMS